MTPPAVPSAPRRRIAWFGHDWGAGFARAVVEHGHTIERVFTEDALRGDGSREIRALGASLGVPVTGGRPSPADLDGVRRSGVDLIICAGYPWRIPVTPGPGPRGLNMHPTLLPEGRGPSPFPHLILGAAQAGGVTVHELAADIDHGPILHQVPFPVLPDDTHDSLSRRSQAVGREVLIDVLDDLDRLWAMRRPQTGGSWWPTLGAPERTLPLAGSVAGIDRVARAFLPGEPIAVLGGRARAVASAVVWTIAHEHAPGTVVSERHDDALVAAADGFALLRLLPRRSPGRALAGRARRRLRDVIDTRRGAAGR